MNLPRNFCLYEFEGFVLDPLQRTLHTLADRQSVRLTARAFDALHLLIEHHGQLVDKDALMKALWPKVVVEENNLTQIISTLRQILGERPGEHRFIATIPGRGYQFVARVKEISQEPITSRAAATAPINQTVDSRVIASHSAIALSARLPFLHWRSFALVLVAAAGAWWMISRRDVPVSEANASVAVLPFVNLTGDAAKDYLGEGMADELINTLTKIQGLKVPARTSSFSYKGRSVDARQIAGELGVGTIVEGSVRSSGNDIRVTAQLINAKDGLHLWSGTYDGQFTDVFSLQDKLAREIATALYANLNGNGVVRIANEPPTQDVEAYRLYLQGIALLESSTEPNVVLALDHFQQAIARDDKFARAYEGAAFSYLALSGVFEQPEQPSLLAAERAARRASALDPRSASAFSSLSVISVRRGRWLDAEAQSQTAVALNPSDTLAHQQRAALLSRVGRLRDALQEMRKAYELSPSNAEVLAALASYLALQGFDSEADKYARLAVNLGVSLDTATMRQRRHIEALRAKRYDEAAETIISMMDNRNTDAEEARTAEIIRSTYAALGDPDKRSAALTTYGRLYPHVSSTTKAIAVSNNPLLVACTGGAHGFAMLGEFDVAYELANYCLDTGVSAAYTAANSRLWTPELSAFRRDPRFAAYLARLGDLVDYYKKYGPPDDCEFLGAKLTCH